MTGLTRSASLQNIYREIGWLRLDDRRKYQKIVLISKIVNGLTPNYLHDIFPQQINANQLDLMACRTELFAKSFFPSAVSLWNDLPEHIKSVDSLSLFKSLVLRTFPGYEVPQHFFVGIRKYSIYHARIRNKCSNLNSDLFNNHISQNPGCTCGHLLGDDDHYLFNCTRYTEPRLKLFSPVTPFSPFECQLVSVWLNQSQF